MTVAQREARKIAKSKEGGPEKDLSEVAAQPHPAAEDTASLRRRVRLDAARKVAVNAALARQKDGPPAGSSEVAEKAARQDPPVTWSKRKAGLTEPPSSDLPSPKRMKTRSRGTVGDGFAGPDSKGTKALK
jgi:hypothetical protein